jgi:uncharacterized SAM-binding protein YcdF (DUF218 family)
LRIAVVLGAAVRPDGTASPTLRLRTEHAIALHRSGLVDRVFFTGGVGRHGPPESDVAAAIALAAGLPADRIDREARSTRTVENLSEAAARLPPGARIVIVSNRWHLPRAVAAARLIGLAARGSGPKATAPPGATSRAMLREVAAMPGTLLTAWRIGRARKGGK